MINTTTQHNEIRGNENDNNKILSLMLKDEIKNAQEKKSSKAILKDIIGEWL